MQTGTGTPQRTRRVKPLALSLAGLLIAVALIGGGVAGLDRHLLSNDGVRPFDGRSDGDAVVLAPAQPRTILDRAAPEAFVPGPDGATAVPRVTDRADRGTGGAAAPPERAVRAGRAAPADERPVGDASTGFAASLDSDDDGLTDVVEERLGTDAHRPDTDGDDLPDGWEADHGLNPTSVADADADSDGDGLSNRTEFRVRSDPRMTDTDANGRPDGEDDTDGDGLPDGVEDDMHAADPSLADTAGGGADGGATDRDGATNETEVGQGADLAVPDGPAAPEPASAAPAAPAPDAAPAPEPSPAPALAPASR